MNLCLTGVLDAAALARIHEGLARLDFADGNRSAGWHAREVKHNEQLTDPQLGDLVLRGLKAHPVFQAAALPRRLQGPLFSRYRPGMRYGTHVDNAIMGSEAAPLRSDLAVTVFLSPPDRYDGGELLIESHGGIQDYKLDAGQALVYPATSLHRVEPVTRGERLAAILWVQSFVRDGAQREILFDLDTARKLIWEQAAGQATPSFDLLAKSYANLLRAWAET